jgi:guanylate kinase
MSSNAVAKVSPSTLGAKMSSPTAGKLIVISGPSGAGKTTVLKKVFARDPRLVSSISATTRPPRPDERDGVDYYFLDDAEFQRRRAHGDFLECCQVFGTGYWYGTLVQAVTPSLAAGKWVVLEIDVQGAEAVLQRYPGAITIFVRPTSLAELERRLRSRGTENEEAIERRLEAARREVACANRYQHQVVNDDVDRAAQEIYSILVS